MRESPPLPGGVCRVTIACPCGKAVEVPVLSQLRAAKGQAALSPEVEIQTLMTQKALPVEPDCCLCGCDTTDTLMLLAICETPEAPSMAGEMPKSGCLIPFLGLWGWLALTLLLRDSPNSNPTERRIEVRFPLRMCRSCAAEVSSWDVIREAMKRTPVYRRLLRKYPECQLGTVKAI